MNMPRTVKKTLTKFENGGITPSELKKIEEVDKLFEEMVSKGFMSRPTYDLAPIGTIFIDYSKL
ncbi:MAG TPA: hypothetical protein VGV92_03075 [Gammaproteobacteria bacterium]|nr:hypothetical protein [Gammaproteobacteria bacterium]